MDEEKRPLSEEEAIAFAGVSESTLHRYISAGFINPTVDGESRFFDEEELIQVFELSPKRAAASRKALKKKTLSPAEKLISEKDRLVADKDIQIRDLKDQRSWLQSRVERLEVELLAAKSRESHGPIPLLPVAAVPMVTGARQTPKVAPVVELEASEWDAEELISKTGEASNDSLFKPFSTAPLASAELMCSALSELESNRPTNFQPEGSLKKVLRYLGFIKPEPVVQPAPLTSRASEIIALDRTGERVATVLTSDDALAIEAGVLPEMDESQEGSHPILSNVIEVKFPGTTASPEAPPAYSAIEDQSVVGTQTATTQPLRGNRPFRESKQTLAELLGDDRPLDPSFAANDETE